jgi:transposase
MLAISGSARIFLYREPTDLRKGFEGLSALLQNMSENITSGSLFVFINRPRNRMKVLYWDGEGLAIWYKRLEKGTFARKQIVEANIGRREFLMLLEGVVPKKVHKRYRLIK